MDQAIILHIIKHHITPPEAILLHHTMNLTTKLVTVPTKHVRPITRQFTKLSLNTRRSRTVKMFPRKFASILRKRFAIKKNTTKAAILQEAVTTTITNTNLRFAILKAKKHCMTHHENVCHYETVDVPHKEPKQVPEKICHVSKHHSYGGHSSGSHHGK